MLQNLYKKNTFQDYTERKILFNFLSKKTYSDRQTYTIAGIIKISFKKKKKLKIKPSKIKFLLKSILENTKDKYDDIYIVLNASGEAYFFFQAFNKIAEKNGSKSPYIITTRQYHNKLAEMFIPNVKYSFMQDCLDLSFCKEKIIKKFGHRFFICLPVFHYINWEREIKINHNLHYYTSFLEEFGLTPKDIAPPPKAIIPDNVREMMLEKVQKTGLNLENFIFVSPEADSNPSCSVEFWEKLNKKLNLMGYDVFYNIFQGNIHINNIKHCKLDKQEVQALCQLSKGIIGIKSGLIEPLCTIHNIPIISIYTSMYERLWGYMKPMDVKDHMRACSNLKLPNINPVNIYELNGEKLPDDELLEVISNIIKPQLQL